MAKHKVDCPLMTAIIRGDVEYLTNPPWKELDTNKKEKEKKERKSAEKKIEEEQEIKKWEWQKKHMLNYMRNAKNQRHGDLD